MCCVEEGKTQPPVTFMSPYPLYFLQDFSAHPFALISEDDLCVSVSPISLIAGKKIFPYICLTEWTRILVILKTNYNFIFKRSTKDSSTISNDFTFLIYPLTVSFSFLLIDIPLPTETYCPWWVLIPLAKSVDIVVHIPLGPSSRIHISPKNPNNAAHKLTWKLISPWAWFLRADISQNYDERVNRFGINRIIKPKLTPDWKSVFGVCELNSTSCCELIRQRWWQKRGISFTREGSGFAGDLTTR